MIAKIISSLFGDGASKVVESVGGLFTSDKERLQLENDAYNNETNRIKLIQDVDLAQAKTNLEEVKRGFGWRTALGWTLVVSVATYFLPKYLFTAAFWVVEMYHAQAVVPYTGNVSELYELMLPMLGFGALKTVEKLTGKRK